ncbi:MAG TPA: UvrD-helicase domain-containing protein [Polyangiaceae bacterium]|nr:UvrD-helicase domain-containing protein [Polyangiaceae bacterium]
MTSTVDTEAASGLRLVSASAGSGKTYRLTEEVTRAVNPSAARPIEIEGLVGVTYTIKAQAELEARIRHVLVENGAFERAQQLPLAYLGTVHAVCLRLLKEFAVDAGLSPMVDVIPGNEGRRLLQAALERELDPALRSRLQVLASELQFEWDGRSSRNDWVTPVDEIMTLARGNRILPDQLPVMAQRSIDGLLELLPVPVADGRTLETELASVLATAIEKLEEVDDRQKNTAEAVKTLRSAAGDLAADRLQWATWAKLAKVAPGKRGVAIVAPVREAASAYEVHPAFRAQLRELTELIFEAARVGLVAYAKWKAQRGLVDYVDMIDRALAVLGVAEVAQELRERLALVVVDEFQDTSPIQLALFMRLHQLCENSVWVGDRKQCIFEYAGADPALMEAVTHWAGQSGGQREFLAHNYRSRPELVEATSGLFAGVFERHGYTLEEVVTSAKRERLPELEKLAPIGIWWLSGKEQTGLANGVARLLEVPSATPVLDRISGKVRDLRPGDIAILVYSNLEAAGVSSALKAQGIATVLPRVGLITTPEGTLVSAALRILVDGRDTLAAAEIDALTGFDGRTPDQWLTDRIRVQRSKQEAADRWRTAGKAGESPAAAPGGAAAPWSIPIEALRAELPVLSPAEALDRVLAVLDLPALAARWPDPAQRLANLEALRALAAAYEERCSYQREAASLAGLLRYFEETQQEIRQRDEERATDEQHVGGSEDAVVISTYHKAKGLEWPVVILGSLGRKRRRDAFDVTPESDRDAFDAKDPLGGRWIRYWPWPLGAQKSEVPLADRAADSRVGRAIAERDGRERARLLYVGFTRARDHLILGVHLLKKGPATTWLDELRSEDGALLTLPEPTAIEPVLGIHRTSGASLDIPVRAWSLDGDEEPAADQGSTEQRCWFTYPPSAVPDAPAYHVAPSRAATESLVLGQVRLASTTRFTSRMPFTAVRGTNWDHVGNTLHAFLAADYPELSAAERAALALRILGQAHLDGSFTADALLSASDALRTFVAGRWPDAIWHREVPVIAALDSEHGPRRISGSIDLLLETPKGFVIIDHKSFPGAATHWGPRALEYGPQIMTYSKAIEMAGGAVIGRFIHFTVGGGMAELVPT